MLKKNEKSSSKQHQKVENNSVGIQVSGDLIISYGEIKEVFKRNYKIELPERNLIDDENSEEIIKNILNEKNTSEQVFLLEKLFDEGYFKNFINKRNNSECFFEENGFDWSLIDSGFFIFGKKHEEKEVNIGSFSISRYPVTVNQYKEFVNDSGYKNKKWWRGIKEQKKNFKIRDSDNPHHPQTNINWFECVAYCRWLAYETKLNISLPDEYQWEKAARGNEGFSFPWGNDYIPKYSNTLYGNKKKTKLCKIGELESDVSSNGVYDMFGNTLEWCLNKYNNSRDCSIDFSTDMRALKGFSYLEKPNKSDLSRREGNLPYMRKRDVGFRIVYN